MKAVTCALLFGFAGTVAAKPLTKSFAPDNDLYLEDSLTKDANLTEEDFNRIVDYVAGFYTGLAEQHGGKLVMDKKWEDPTVNAYARQEGSDWHVAMFGGLARRSEVTEDGFALVVCHELGHHFGGFPFYGDTDWAAAEGQSDYFATIACARRIWADQAEENARFRALAPELVKTRCDSVWQDTKDQDLCYRSALAGKSLGLLLATLGNEAAPDFATPDTNVVTQTSTAHPAGQCRLDTYFAGALCREAFDPSVIPARSANGGQASVAAERTAARYACTEAALHSIGTRPKCWYGPRLTLHLAGDAVAISEETGNGNGAWEPGETYLVNPALQNDLLVAAAGARLAVTAKSRGISISRAESAYPEVAPGEKTHADRGVPVAVDRALTCGDTFELEARAKLADWQSSPLAMAFVLGDLRVTDDVNEGQRVTIPDNSPAGISRTLVATSEQAAARLTVDVAITHTFPGDLSVVLTAPNGTEYKLFDRRLGTGRNLALREVIDLRGKPSQGEWRLVVKDLAGYDVGTLDRWALKFETAVCEQDQMRITRLR